MAQWLGLPAFSHVTQVQSLVGELRSGNPFSTAKKKKKKNSSTQSLMLAFLNGDFILISLLQISGKRHVCCCSVAQSYPTPCDPMDCSTPGIPVLHHLPKLAQTHVHCIGDAVQPSYTLLSPSPPAFIRVFSNESTLCIQSIGASASALVFLMNIQD